MLTKAIPTIEFPSVRKPVAEPSMEPLVYLDDEFECDSDYYHFSKIGGKAVPGTSPSIMARKTVCMLLHEAEALLPDGYHFRIYDAYRPIPVQQFLYNRTRAEKAAANPGKSNEEIDRITQLCSSFPSYNILLPSLHNSGGAVDLTIIGSDGEPLDMGCDFDEFTDRAWTGYYEDYGKGAGISEKARDNRRLLYNVMIAAGFTNFPSEWWHYDYGDEKWAQFTGREPFYAGVLSADLRNSTEFEHSDLVRSADAEQQRAAAEISELYEKCRELDEKVAAVMRK